MGGGGLGGGFGGGLGVQGWGVGWGVGALEEEGLGVGWVVEGCTECQNCKFQRAKKVDK